MRLTVFGSGFDSLNFTSGESAVGIGSVFYTCDDVSASAQQLNCTLPRVHFAGASFLPVFLFNRTSGSALTDKGWVGLQYQLPATSSTAAPAPVYSSTGGDGRITRSSSSSSTGSATTTVSVAMLSGCGWTAEDAVLFGCVRGSTINLSVDRMDSLPADWDWELAVYNSNNSVKASQACGRVNASVLSCTLPSVPAIYAGWTLPAWLQDSQRRVISSGSLYVVYATTPAISAVTGCCYTDFRAQSTYGCATASLVLTVFGSGFATAWNSYNGAPDLSPLVLQGPSSTHQCLVSYHTDSMLVCSGVQPPMAQQDDGELLQLSVVPGWGVNISNAWKVQVSSGAANCSSSGTGGSGTAPPLITDLTGDNCQQVPTGIIVNGNGAAASSRGVIGGERVASDQQQQTVELSCGTNSATLFTIVGSGFSNFDGLQVQLESTTTHLQYSCGVSSLTDTAIVCIDVEPRLESKDSNSDYQLTVVSRLGPSNVWWVRIADQGPYMPPSTSHLTTANMIIAAFSMAAVFVFVTLLCVVARACCCPSVRATSLSSGAAAAGMHAPLLDPPPAYIAEPSLAYPASSSRFGLSLPPDPSNYPAVHRSNAY